MTDSDLNWGPEPDPALVDDYMRKRYRTRRGWRWEAVQVSRGWYRVWQRGQQPFDIEFGGLLFLGPRGAVMSLSSNPLIHGFDETQAVLTELGDSDLSGTELAAEILRRTARARA